MGLLAILKKYSTLLFLQSLVKLESLRLLSYVLSVPGTVQISFVRFLSYLLSLLPISPPPRSALARKGLLLRPADPC